MSIISPNMGLVISTVGVDTGLQWEQNSNASAYTIDSHNHSPGSGVQITPQGMNISSSLNFQNNSAQNIYGLMFSMSGTSTATGLLYTAPSSGGGVNDLFYNDFAGNVIQITKSGIVNAVASSIPGESYAGGTFTWKQGAGSTTPANFDIGSVILRPNTAGTTNGITLSPPSGIASAYSLALPALPPSQQIMTLDASGNITAPYTFDNVTIQQSSSVINVVNVPNGAITATQIANNTITATKMANNSIATVAIQANAVTRPKLVSVGQQISSSSGSASTTSTTYTDVPNLNVTITTSGRPVMIFLQSAGTSAANLVVGVGGNGFFQIISGSTPLAVFQISGASTSQYPGSTVFYLDTPAAGTYTYKVQFHGTSLGSGASIFCNNAVLVAYEL